MPIDPHFHTLASDLGDAFVDRGNRSEIAGRLDEAIWLCTGDDLAQPIG